jgi:hypothetical protein
MFTSDLERAFAPIRDGLAAAAPHDPRTALASNDDVEARVFGLIKSRRNS